MNTITYREFNKIAEKLKINLKLILINLNRTYLVEASASVTGTAGNTIKPYRSRVQISDDA